MNVYGNAADVLLNNATYQGALPDILENIHGITKIPMEILRHFKDGWRSHASMKPLSSVGVAVKMSWASTRQTTRREDEAYCLLRIFGINMPLLYGEGNEAFRRLQEEIIKLSNDQSIFAWSQTSGLRGFADNNGARMLAPSASCFKNSASIVPRRQGQLDLKANEIEISKSGISMSLPLISTTGLASQHYFAVLDCVCLDHPEAAVVYVLGGYIPKLKRSHPSSADHWLAHRHPRFMHAHRLTSSDGKQPWSVEPLDGSSRDQRLSKDHLLAIWGSNGKLDRPPAAFDKVNMLFPRDSGDWEDTSAWHTYEEQDGRPVQVHIATRAAKVLQCNRKGLWKPGLQTRVDSTPASIRMIELLWYDKVQLTIYFWWNQDQCTYDLELTYNETAESKLDTENLDRDALWQSRKSSASCRGREMPCSATISFKTQFGDSIPVKDRAVGHIPAAKVSLEMAPVGFDDEGIAIIVAEDYGKPAKGLYRYWKPIPKLEEPQTPESEPEPALTPTISQDSKPDAMAVLEAVDIELAMAQTNLSFSEVFWD